MASAIVTSTYRYKRPPRKKKAGRPAADCMSGTESDHLRSVRQGPHAQRGAHEAERYAELLTGIEGASSRPVRRIVLIDG